MKLSKIFLSETTRPSANIFNLLHHQKILYQSCSNYAPGVLYYWLHCCLWLFPQVSDPGPSGPSCLFCCCVVCCCVVWNTFFAMQLCNSFCNVYSYSVLYILQILLPIMKKSRYRHIVFKVTTTDLSQKNLCWNKCV